MAHTDGLEGHDDMWMALDSRGGRAAAHTTRARHRRSAW